MLAPVGNWGGGNVWRVTSGEFSSNAYICEIAQESCILIDGGLDPVSIEKAIEKLKLTPKAVFCTHGHFDHAGSAAYFQKKYDCDVYLHGADHKILKSSNFMLMAFKFASRVEQPSHINLVGDGHSVKVSGYDLIFHGAPGHTPGSCLIEFGSALFTGDTIYSRGVGLSKLKGENPEMLKKSILALWHLLTIDRVVFPGHGGFSTGDQVRTNNSELLRFLGLVENKQQQIKV